MKSIIMGAGAIGSFVGALLHSAGNEVLLVARQQHVDAINQHGLTIEGGFKGASLPFSGPVNVPASTSPAAFGTAELVIITTKAYDTAQALRDCSGAIGKATRVLSLQNGLGLREVVLDFLKQRFGEELARKNGYGGVTSIGMQYMEPGRIRYNAAGKTFIGNYFSPAGKDIVDMFNSAGFAAELSKDINRNIWIKLILNTGINALGAYHNAKNGELAENPQYREELIRLVEEGCAVAEAFGIQVPKDMPRKVVEGARGSADNVNSMLQDILRGSRTEIDYINGKIVELGKSMGVPTPMNRLYYKRIKEIEEGYGKEI